MSRHDTASDRSSAPLAAGVGGALLLPLLLALGSPAAAASTDETAATPVDRVVRLCEAWTAVRYLHPQLAYRDLDWDAAFVEAAPAAWEAGSREAYRAAAEGMLAALGDPATELVETEEGPANGEGASAAEAGDEAEPPPLFDWIEPPSEDGPGGLLRIDAAGYVRDAGTYGLYGALARGADAELAKARAVIVDLRYGEELGGGNDWLHGVLDEHIAGHVAREALGSTDRWLVHWGYRSDRIGSSGGYRSGFVSSLPRTFTPADPEAPPRPFVFLVDRHTHLPDAALAFRAAGNGFVVSVGPPPASLRGDRVSYDLGEGLSARVQVTEKIPPAGVDLGADVVVEPPVDGAEGDDPAVAAARELIARALDEPLPPAGEPTPGEAPALRWRPTPAYPEATAPDLGHRLLAGCRTWGVIRHFYPYLHLLDDWDGAFRSALPELAAAEGEEAYAEAILRLIAHVEDGHTNAWGHPGVAAVRGEVGLPLRLRFVEGAVVVVGIPVQEVEGVEVGDELLAVDGVPIEERIEAMLPLTTGSREITHRLAALRWSVAGPEGSTARLSLRGADGATREAEVARTWEGTPVEEPEGNPWRVLDAAEHETGGATIGYVDLTELETPQVDPMMAALADTDAIVFDLRGYPNGTAWPLAPHLNVHGAEEWAVFRRREVSYQGFGSDREMGFYFVQGIPQRDDVEPYGGRTVMLIDERAISQSEHTALMFRQAAGTTFVGTATAGANGDVTSFVLPGDLNVLFTGHDVRHADGTQLQRVGIQPDVEVSPTLAGIRAGRDEVLERAVEHLRQELAGE